MAHLQGRVVLLVPIGAGTREFFQGADALGRHRVRLHVGVGAARREQALIGEALEGLVHAAGRLAGGIEEFHPGLVGVFFLLPHIGEQGALDHLAGCRHRCRTCIGQAAVAAAARARHHGAGAEQHGDDHLGLRFRQPLAKF